VVAAAGLMCVHAHPDDESIGTGGVLAKAHAEGRRTAVVTCTGGELGEIVGAGLDPEEVRPRLAAVRLEELTRALEILGAGAPRLLGYRDSGMVGTAGNDAPGSFWRADFDEAVGRLVGKIREFRPDVLVAYDAYGLYGHPDHVQAHRVALVAAEACAVPAMYPEQGPAWTIRKVYLSTIPKSFIALANRELAARGLPSPFGEDTDPDALLVGSPDELVTTQVDVGDYLDVKQRALRAHHSQLGQDSFFLNIPEELAAAAFGSEWFIRHRSLVTAPEQEDDLFAGLPPAGG
jgi:N-acetyl-1-D-myo-inositol-2-amino-2-deoxy-alpha-D-glucopyranoside deacetylase